MLLSGPRYLQNKMNTALTKNAPSTAQDYESMAIAGIRLCSSIAETYSGTDIVQWHGRIERQLLNLLDDAEKSRNYPYADKVREFLKIWRANEITGSINRETLETLKSATDVLAVDTWNLSSYFSGLRDSLRTLIASEEELPRGVDMNQNDPYAGMPRGGGGGLPMAPAFGAEEEKPGALEEPPPPGAEGGVPGEEKGPEAGEEGAAKELPPGQTPGEGPPEEEEEMERI